MLGLLILSLPFQVQGEGGDRQPHADIVESARWNDDFGLAQLVYPDLSGTDHSLGEEAFAGHAIVIQVLGSWSPDCDRETAYLARVYDRYKERGLSVVGLAFEKTGEFDRDVEQVRQLRERHQAKYPFLLAGPADKEKAAEALPALGRVIEFPTTIFLHGDGRARAVHTGFASPGPNEEHGTLTIEFERIIEELLAELASENPEPWQALTGEAWRGNGGKLRVRFSNGANGSKGATFARESDRSPHNPISSYPVVVRGSTILIDATPWRFDSAARELVNPRDSSNRLTPAARSASEPTLPLDLAGLGSGSDVLVRMTLAVRAGEMRATGAGPALVACTKHGFAPLRREAARAIGAIGYNAGAEALHALESDIDPLVRDVATKALAQLSRK